jgi:hypothetical protein
MSVPFEKMSFEKFDKLVKALKKPKISFNPFKD